MSNTIFQSARSYSEDLDLNRESFSMEDIEQTFIYGAFSTEAKEYWFKVFQKQQPVLKLKPIDEKAIIISALQRSNDIHNVAINLGMSERSIYRKIKKYKINYTYESKNKR